MIRSPHCAAEWATAAADKARSDCGDIVALWERAESVSTPVKMSTAKIRTTRLPL
jgi:hypothetical protein